MNSNSEKVAKANKVVKQKVMETDDKAHKQMQKLKNSKIGKMIPTEYEKIGIDRVALVSIFINLVMYIYIYITFSIIVPKTSSDSFVTSFSGILLGSVYLLCFLLDLFIYWFKKSGFLLPFLLARALSVAFTIIVIFIAKNFSASFFIRAITIGTNIIVTFIHLYLFGSYISHMKTGGSSETGDHQEV